MQIADYLWLIPILPLLGSALALLFGPRLLRSQTHWPVIACAIGACVLSFFALNAVVNGHSVTDLYQNIPWFHAGDVHINFNLRADGLTAIMLVTVTFVGSLIAIYSIGYMHGDPGYARYFAEISLFLAAMTGLVLADNFILLYACWEGVGLCSYLLVGFWFARPAAAAAARKAFLVTRIGDIGLFIGILILWINVPSHSLNYDDVFAWAMSTTDHGTLTAACLLLFCGAVGKSAQFPLLVWLPDAMEGPSSVSALIHAATMVTAGVYLLARCTPMFALAPEAQLVVATIAGFTALLAALMALTQSDLKRVLAYSTISQLGYMFMALGAAILPGLREEGLGHSRNHGLVAAGVTAGIFHLFTHAFFKALLFLSAGSVMHAMGNIIDMRRFSGLRKLLPYTHWTFLCGAGALSGFPLLAGFWSKDEILHVTFEAGGAPSYTGEIYLIVFVSGMVTAGLTAFYTFRAYFLTFWGKLKVPPEAGEHAHESPWVMVVPLMILAVGAVGAGVLMGCPPYSLMSHLLVDYWMHDAFPALLPEAAHAHAPNIPLMIVSSLFALGGIAVAWWMYIKQPGLASRAAKAAPVGYELSRHRFYLDEIYNALIVKPLSAFAMFCRGFDLNIVDQFVNLTGRSPSLFGRLLSFVQNGLVQFYALLMILGLTGLLISLLLR